METVTVRSLQRLLTVVILLVALPCAVPAQLVVKLSPKTAAQFEAYAKGVEAQLNARWHSGGSFLAIDSNPAERKRVLTGEIVIKQMHDGGPVAIEDGLIHDWMGAVFIAHATAEHVVSILENFNRHKNIYPEVTQSKTLRSNGSVVTGHWRLEQGGLVPVKLDVTEEASYEKISAGKWDGRTYARKIHEIDTGLFSRGKEFPVDEGHGYLWRLYGYWGLEEVNDGVLAECRTLSLSRDIPPGLSWAIGPYVEKQPRASLTSTLSNTRKAAAQH